MSRRRLPAALAACGVLAAVTAACGGGGGGATKTATNGRVLVVAGDIHYDVKTIKASAGPLTVTLHESGALDHTFTMDKPKFELKVTRDHPDAIGTVTLAPGTYQFHCSVDGHAAEGMTGKIVVS